MFSYQTCIPLASLLFFGVLVNTNGPQDQYFGCYKEIGKQAANTTAADCRKTCVRQEVTYYGLRGSSGCLCAVGVLDPVKKVNDANCSLACTGYSSCGGPLGNPIALYSVYGVCPKGKYGPETNCSRYCNCKDNGQCSLVGVCTNFSCATGWKLNETDPKRKQCSIDVDECREKSICSQECSNTVGSYKCNCRKGFILHADKHSCTDIDECAESRCQHYCNNTNGSYKCECKSGFVLASDRHSCDDIDECAQGLFDCQHYCYNANGSYECGCKSGFVLQSDLQSCYEYQEDQTSQVVTVTCSIGFTILSVIIIILVLAVIILLILLKRKHTKHHGKGEEMGLDNYTSLTTRETSNALAEQPESIYTAINPTTRLDSNEYVNFNVAKQSVREADNLKNI